MMPHRRAVAILLFLLLAGCLHQPPLPVQQGEAHWLDGLWPHEKSELPRHESALYGRLENGMRYIIQHNAKPQGRVTMQLNVQVGSLMERDNELGLAHFLEHMAFNGGRNFPPGELIPFFQKNGMAFGRDANAHTSYQETVYKLNLVSPEAENLQQGLLVLRDVADGLSILPEEVDKERGVILAEKAARDSEQYRAGRRVREVLFGGTRFLNDPIGEEEIIRQATAETIRGFYEAWYRPEYMVLVVVGEVNPADVEARIKAMFGDFKPHAAPRPVLPWGDAVHTGLIPFHDRYNAEFTIVRMGAVKPRTWRNDSESVQREMAFAAMANSILSTRLQRIKASGNAPYMEAHVRQSDTFNLFPSADIVAKCEAGKWQASLTVVQDELNRALRHGFMQEEVETVRAEMLRAYAKLAERSANLENDFVAKTIIGCLNGNRVYQSWQQTYDMYSRFFNEATPQLLHNALVSAWNSGNRLLFVTGNADIPGDASAILRAAWQAGEERDIAPPKPLSQLDYPYINEPQVPGTVAERAVLPVPGTALSLHEVRFANGLMLRMLPTPFLQGKSSLSLHTGAGTDAMEDAHYTQAVLASLTDQQSGFGRLSTDEARQLARREGFNAQSSLTPRSLIISGAGETEDMAGILQAMWTQFNDPMIEEKDRAQLLKTLTVADAARDKTVSSAMDHRGRAYFFGASPRNLPVTAQQAQAFTVEQLQHTLRELHAPADGVLNIVGDFDPEQAENLVARYFGAPDVVWAAPDHVSHRQSYVFPPANDRERAFTVRAELGQAALQIAFHRNVHDVSDRREMAVRRLLAAVVRDRLRDTVREELGASYSPGMRYWVEDTDGFGLYIIRIETRTDQLPLLLKAVDDVLADVSTGNIRPDELERQRLPMLSGWETSRRENTVYARLLNQIARQDKPFMQWDAEYPGLLMSITAQDLNAEAAQAFAAQNRAVMTGTEAPAGE